MDQLPLTLLLIKKDGQLVVKNKLDQIKLDSFLENIKEGDKAEVTYEPIHSEISYAQLSKIHKCIRVIASDTGCSFEDIKKLVKEKSGLYAKIEHLKSFSGLTKDEASKVIETIMEMANFLGINLYN